MSFYIVELDFIALRTIRSLPPFHGARWSAVLRHVCRDANIDMDSLILGIYPWRRGIEPISQGEHLGLRVLVDTKHTEPLCTLFDGLKHGRHNEGEFSLGDSLRFNHVYCGLSGVAIGDTIKHLISLSVEHYFAFAHTLSRSEKWSMRFDVPLRLARPQGRHTSNRYCDQEFFTENLNVLPRIIEKIRFLPWQCSNVGVWPTLVNSDLRWQDMRYNKERGMALGGVVGSLDFFTAPDPSLALALAYGQFSGVGKNPRFGLGYYTIVV